MRFVSCSVPGCDGNAHWEAKGARGWCVAHYYRWKRNGDPLAGRASAGVPWRFLQEVVLTHTSDDCLIWPHARNSDGYGMIAIDGKSTRVSRIACEAEHGKPPTPEHEAAHSCGNGALGCCSKKHLYWATSAENSADKIGHGTANRGERHLWSKLTAAQVLQMRDMAATSTPAELAKRFGVSRRNVSMVLSRNSWAWLEPRAIGSADVRLVTRSGADSGDPQP